ncbi:hypothetical protein Sjap_020174 [Stephania japonica]|uniref:non-specific serine/threonine protein kinase n=1 Tax=Stephania japonica TaxID=461633 RepID=A0AAP0F2W9_9MAGN
MLQEALLMLFLSLSCICSSASYHADVTQKEAEALLQWRASLVSHSLPSWLISNHSSSNPCEWVGVRCDTFGRVGEINLANFNLSGTLHQFNFLIFTNLTSLNLNSNDLFGPIPYHIGSLSKLTTLDLSHNNFTGNIPKEIGEFRELQVLHLYNNSLSGAIPHQLISNLQEVWDLDLSFNRLENPDPLMHYNNGSMASLTHLLLHHNSLGLEFPTFIFQCHKLIILDFSYNNIAGSIPLWLSPNAFNQLESLNLSTNQFEGPIPQVILRHSKLRELALSENKLNGSIPEEKSLLSNLESLVFLNLFENQISGFIPPSIGRLRNLKGLRLYQNHLSGSFPPEIGNLSNLVHLDLSENQISGFIPSSIGRLRNLKEFWLYQNHLSGSLPPEIGNLSNLVDLDLSENKISGFIPPSIGRLRNLKELWLYQNHLSGSLPPEIGNLSNLVDLELSANQISGFIPPSIGCLRNLEELWLYQNQLSGSLPLEIGNLSKLEALNLLNNAISGSLPVEIGCLSNLVVLRILNNHLSGPLPYTIGNASRLEYIQLRNNQLMGTLTVEVGKLSNLVELDLSNNHFSGSVPDGLSSINTLKMLKLHGNNFHAMPHSFHNASNLVTIMIHENQIQGTIPRSLTNCKNLEILDLGINMMSDAFPCWLGSLPMLRVLSLRSNKFHGPLKCSKTKHGFPSLHFLDLSSNEFSGYLCKEFFEAWKSMRVAISSNESHLWNNVTFHQGYVNLYSDFYESVTVPIINKGQYVLLNKSLEMFKFLDLSNNHLQGEIPEEIGELKALVALNLSRNAFIGKIPSSIWNLSELEAMDLSQNNLSGEIPNQLTGLTFLAILNLSSNQLTGVIPHGNQFNTFSPDSYEGNPGLCGFPLSKQCKNVDSNLVPLPTLDEEDVESSTIRFDWKFMLMGYGSGVILTLARAVRGFGDHVSCHVPLSLLPPCANELYIGSCKSLVTEYGDFWQSWGAMGEIGSESYAESLWVAQAADGA